MCPVVNNVLVGHIRSVLRYHMHDRATDTIEIILTSSVFLYVSSAWGRGEQGSMIDVKLSLKGITIRY